nr:stage II sporulation protein M [Pseudomonas sp.]
MKQSQFESRHRGEWLILEGQLESLERGTKAATASYRAFPAAYRRLCQQLAVARARGYSEHLIAHLQQLAQRGHQQLYRHRSPLAGRLLAFLLSGFPRLVRAEWRSLLAASLLFYGSLMGTGVLVYLFPELVFSFISPEQVVQMEAMYDPQSARLGRFSERGAGGDWLMFGYYVMNNIGIAFQTFAGGLLLGLGSLFYLLFNGLTIGAVAGHLTQIGHHQPFWSFVVGHAAFELTAITLAGAAGLKLGAALLAPGCRSRADALRLAAQRAIRLVAGATLMLLVAAFIEAYWSSMTYVDAPVKYAVGLLLWLLVALYLGRSGGSRHAAE